MCGQTKRVHKEGTNKEGTDFVGQQRGYRQTAETPCTGSRGLLDSVPESFSIQKVTASHITCQSQRSIASAALRLNQELVQPFG